MPAPPSVVAGDQCTRSPHTTASLRPWSRQCTRVPGLVHDRRVATVARDDAACYDARPMRRLVGAAGLPHASRSGASRAMRASAGGCEAWNAVYSGSGVRVEALSR